MSRPKKDTESAIKAVKDYVKHHPHEVLTWAVAAEVTGLSRSTLCRTRKIAQILSDQRKMVSAFKLGSDAGALCDKCMLPFGERKYFVRTIEMHHKREAILIEIMKERGINIIEIASILEEASS